MEQFKKGQQVVVRRRVVNHPKTRELRVGTIVAFAEDDKALVSIPGPGGSTMRQIVALDQLEPVSERFKRASVQFNPAFRNILGYQLR